MITSELLEAYLACPMKCYLQSNGEKCSEKQVCRFAPDPNGLVPSCRQLFPLMPAASIALTNAAEKGDPRSYRARESVTERKMSAGGFRRDTNWTPPKLKRLNI